jgi:hypothetical protein
MAKNSELTYPAPKRGLPWELKFKFAQGQLTTLFKGIMNEIREKYGAAAALEIAEKVWKRENRVKKMVQTLKDVFRIEGNDIGAIQKWWEVYWELVGQEVTILEQSKTFTRSKITKCPWSTPEPKDINDWEKIFNSIVSKTINPKITVERPKAMCAGDPYCEYVWKIEE